MTRALIAVGLVVFVWSAAIAAQRGLRTTSELQCVAPLGAGVESKRAFCDVLIGSVPTDSVAVEIPPYTGTATLQFDLHNRFTVPAIVLPGALAFSRHEALVSVVQPSGEAIAAAAVVREFRVIADLFDQIGGGAHPGGVKGVAPGPAESVRVTVPAGLTAVGIVGARLAVLTRVGQEVFDTPGRPVAIVSNVRVEYRPR